MNNYNFFNDSCYACNYFVAAIVIDYNDFAETIWGL